MASRRPPHFSLACLVPTGRLAAGLLATGLLATGLLAASMFTAARVAHAEIIDEVLRLQQASLTYGTGIARLDGMGLRLALKDENDEIDLFDYGDNPAGLLSDRESWSVDTRFTHDERLERNPELPGNRFKSNIYSFLGTARTSGQAFGGGLDYIQSTVESKVMPRTNFTNSRMRFLYSRQAGRFSVGGEFRALNENENIVNSPSLYPIEHKTTNLTGVLGIAYAIQEHVTIAGRGALRHATVNGLAESDSHLDKFTWKRPAGTAEGQFFVDFPRLNGAAAIQRTKGAGEERLDASWSQLFLFNPTTSIVNFDRRTFTEDTENTGFRTRWRYDLKPELLTLAAAFDQNKQTSVIRASQVTIGSRAPSDITLKYYDLGVGAGLHLANDRVFVGGELHNRSDEYQDLDRFEGYRNKTTTTDLSIGAEYLMLENLAARAGFSVGSEKRDFEQGLSGTFSSSAASLGVGLVPSGGILELDAAYLVGLSSELDVDLSRFTMYARLFF